jgi:hypothetical protein
VDCTQKCITISRNRKTISLPDYRVSIILLIEKQFYLCYDRINQLKNKIIKVAYENNDKKMDSVYSQRIRAGKRRTYFFDVRETRGNDYYLTITESRKKFNEDGYDRHKIFLYKEDFNKFLKGMTEAIDFVKTDLMPDFDFDAFNHENPDNYEGNAAEVKKEIVEIKPPSTEDIKDEVPVKIADTSIEQTVKTESIEPPPASSLHDEEVDKW